MGDARRDARWAIEIGDDRRIQNLKRGSGDPKLKTVIPSINSNNNKDKDNSSNNNQRKR
jgi:hypothetical protein